MSTDALQSPESTESLRRRGVVIGGVCVCVVALVAGTVGGTNAATPVGFVGGLYVAVRGRDLGDEVIAGALVGTVGSLGFLTVTFLWGLAPLVEALGPAFGVWVATSGTLKTALVLVPLSAIESSVVGGLLGTLARATGYKPHL
ncbi:hypothetical protein VB773_07380 [Haloarculaceae archaeon H-GB2-1]|nr:hypothetical protein [Haloarculaceae archaeon H-GB1-1]MEA5385895.1 hypothetical protein [Haloarculaceae archaeon H-GB11]MEA5407404.1 hypothetical protein [Haloarculaceae archaeon H-GB2-1]